MISFLKGKIETLGPLELHLDVNGTGYKVNITLSDSERLARMKDQPIKVFIRVQYTETSQNLYGFLDEEVADLYDFLIKLHGIGPKIVMSILSYCQINDFLSSLEAANAAYLTGVPGIGKSKAEKILFEAKSKQKKLELLKARWAQSQFNDALEKTGDKTGNTGSLKNDIFSDLLVQSLEGLGFSPKEISLAEKKISLNEKDLPGSDMENIQKWIRIYLRYL